MIRRAGRWARGRFAGESGGPVATGYRAARRGLSLLRPSRPPVPLRSWLREGSPPVAFPADEAERLAEARRMRRAARAWLACAAAAALPLAAASFLAGPIYALFTLVAAAAMAPMALFCGWMATALEENRPLTPAEYLRRCSALLPPR
ncbi:MAG: hypothetical protein OYG32_14720 [Rhodospirillaceae bacterium]|nr:hypothetical protein [Rhodospirillaceae bacterium]